MDCQGLKRSQLPPPPKKKSHFVKNPQSMRYFILYLQHVYELLLTLKEPNKQAWFHSGDKYTRVAQYVEIFSSIVFYIPLMCSPSTYYCKCTQKWLKNSSIAYVYQAFWVLNLKIFKWGPFLFVFSEKKKCIYLPSQMFAICLKMFKMVSELHRRVFRLWF